MFIKQFWLRRDPTPGTPVNKFKEEHYRRIAYANAHFAFHGPGWKTDRGRIYILYGPPDEIENHPVPGDEQWLYHHINGIGEHIIVEFDDPQHSGDFKQTLDPHRSK
jgi:GWxTD domain-containing protein